jgi:hypothetical protein
MLPDFANFQHKENTFKAVFCYFSSDYIINNIFVLRHFVEKLILSILAITTGQGASFQEF